MVFAKKDYYKALIKCNTPTCRGYFLFKCWRNKLQYLYIAYKFNECRSNDHVGYHIFPLRIVYSHDRFPSPCCISFLLSWIVLFLLTLLVFSFYFINPADRFPTVSIFGPTFLFYQSYRSIPDRFYLWSYAFPYIFSSRFSLSILSQFF